MGVFGDEHRHSVEYSKSPQLGRRLWRQKMCLLVTSGVNLWGIARAMVANVQVGRLVAGGSTITQQTAKIYITD